jgi:hypothetical protein
MRASLLVFTAAAGLTLATAGCARPGLGANLILNSAIVAYDLSTVTGTQREWRTEDGSPPVLEEEVDPAAQAALAHVPLAVPPAQPMPAVVQPTHFDLGSAYGALGHVDLEACKTEGLAPGYGRVLLAFEPDGTPAHVAVQMPAGSAPSATRCVVEAFRGVRVAPFDGAPVNVRRQFYVE